MSITLAMLSWGAHKTLINTLESYRRKGLLDLVSDRIIYFQEISDKDREIAKEYNFFALGSPINEGIASGYMSLLENLNTSQFLFLENDWELTAKDEDVLPIFAQAAFAVENHKVVIARLRSRKNFGAPLWTLQFQGKEWERPTHLLDCVHWEKNPERFHPITALERGMFPFYTTTANYANWTNNPTIANTGFLMRTIYPRLAGDIEQSLQPWWETQNFAVGQGEGLFTHNRIG